MKTRKLHEICTSITDCPHSTPTWTEQGKLVIRNQYIKNGRLDLSKPSYTDEENFIKRCARAKPLGGDIIITREAPMGEVCIVPEDLECCLGQRIVLLKVDESVCDNRYLLYMLMSRTVQHQISWSEGTGTTVSNLRIPHLENLDIPYTDLPIQRAIGSTLSCLDEKIELNKRINYNLEAQAQAIFKSWFLDFEPFLDGEFIDSELGWIPKGWRIGRFGDLVKIIKNTEKFPNQKDIIYEHYSIPAYDEKKYPVFDHASSIKSNKTIINKSCFLVSKLNPSFKRIWRPNNITSNAICSTEFIAIEPIDKLSRSFSYAIADSIQFHNFLKQHTTGSTGSRQRVSPKVILEYPVVIPDVENVERYCRVADVIYRKADILLEQNKTLATLRDALLPKLMSGEIEVSMSNDEVVKKLK